MGAAGAEWWNGAPTSGGLKVQDLPYESHTSVSHTLPDKAGEHAQEAVRQVIPHSWMHAFSNTVA